MDRVHAESADWDMAFAKMDSEREAEAIKKAQDKARR